MEPDFLATIKLITGEEIIAKVSYMPYDDSLVLENPMEVNSIAHQGKGVKINGFSLLNGLNQPLNKCLYYLKSM